MDKNELVVIHYNPAMAHQVRQADGLAAGLAEHGQAHAMTTVRGLDGAVHIVLGPNYALDDWRHHPRVVLLDRAHWGDPAFVSLGWLLPGGDGRYFPQGQDASRWDMHKPAPAELPLTPTDKRLVFGDFGADRTAINALFRELSGACTFRAHPSDPWSGCPVPQDNRALNEVLRDYGEYYGWRTSALTAAALAGRVVHALNQHHVCARLRVQPFQEWCYDLAWMNWREDELATGDAWSWLHATEHHRDTVERQPDIRCADTG